MRFKNILSILFTFLIAFCQINGNVVRNEQSQVCGERFQVGGFVVGGNKVTNRLKWPWLVAFVHNEANKFFCGGSLISKRHTLGAAHCFQNKGDNEIVPPEHITAHLGKFNLSDIKEKHSKSSWVSQILIHPDWDPEDIVSFDADVAVVVLGEEVEFSAYIYPVCLPPQSDAYVTENGTVAGWGQSNSLLEFAGTHEQTPIEIELPAVKASKCYPRFPQLSSASSERMFCAGYDNQSRGTCLGDSGGGFYVLISPSMAFQVKGIVSAGQFGGGHACDVNKYSLYTNVGWFSGWIEGKIKETSEAGSVEVGLKCRNSDLRKIYDVYCDHSFAGPFNQNIRISSTPQFAETFWNSDIVEGLWIYFGKSTHIFSGISKTFKNLKKLRINGELIKFIKRSDFADLTELKELTLYYFKITFIPVDTFYDLPVLERFEISYSALQTLPVNLFQFSNNLIELELTDNRQLTQIPDELFKNTQNLKILSISISPQLKLAKSFWNLPELEVFELADSNLENVPENLLANSEKLKKLNLRSNELKKLDKKFKSNFLHLEYLNLAENPLELAPDSFDEFPNLKKLNLNSCRLTSLPENIFDHLTKLEELNLSENQLTFLSENIFDRLTELEELNLSENQLTFLSENIFDHLTKLEELNLSENQLTFFSENIFDRLTELEVLYSDRNRLTFLSENIFAKNLKLKEIHLGLNRLTKIRFDFTKLKKIEIVDLEWNSCINDGAGKYCWTSLADLQRIVNLNCSAIGET